jgi:hypothetical protein
VVHDEAFARWWARFLRMGASPGAAMALSAVNFEIDIRDVLPAIRVPTLLLHAVGDRTVEVQCSRYMATRIPHARYVELPSDDHLPWLSDADAIVDEIRRLVATAGTPAETDRLLLTTMVVELLPADAARAGEAEPREGRYHELARVDTIRFRSRFLAASGPIVLAAFDGPARAIRCARAIVDDLQQLGLTARAGLHTGECEVRPAGLGGVAVDVARLIAAGAEGGEVIVSGTVKDLVAGSGLDFRPGEAKAASNGAEGLPLFALASPEARPAR